MGGTAVAAAGVDSLLRDGTQALYADGDLFASRRAFDLAYRLAERAGHGGAMAQAALGLGGLWLPAERGAAESVLVRMRLRRALAQVVEGAPVALRLRARLAAEADHGTGDHATVLHHLAEARRSGDPVAHAEAAALARDCVSGPDHRRLRWDLTRELTEAAGRSGRRCDPLLGMLWTTVGLFQDADPRAGASLAELRRLLSIRDHAAIGSAVRAIEVMGELRAGRLASAQSAAEAGAGRALSAGDPDAAHWHLLQMMAIRWFQGRLADLGSAPHEWAEPLGLDLAAAHGGERLSGRDLAELPRTDDWLARLYMIVEWAAVTGDAELSAAAYELLRPYARQPMTAGPAVACFGSTRQALGLAALASGGVDSAVGHLREAVRDNRTLGHRPAATLSRWRLGRALALRGQAGDRAEAARERAAAEREAAEMGMTLPDDWVHRAESVRVTGAARAAHPIRCRRVGKQWEISLEHRTVRVAHRRGVVYLAMLCASPGREIPAAELVAGPALLKTAATESAARSVQTVLDDVARREYRRRLSVLRREIDEGAADAERAARARAERDWLLAELAATTGLGGRSREFGNAEERARVAVGKAIRRALAYVEAADPVIGRRLRDSVHTGVRCCYLPV